MIRIPDVLPESDHSGSERVLCFVRKLGMEFSYDHVELL